MRVALVYRSFHRAGSLARGTVELARHLSRQNEVHVFSIGPRTERSLAPDCVFHDVPVAHLGTGRSTARELATFARNSAALLAHGSFDVVHACAPSTWAADLLHVPGIAREEARLQGIPAWRHFASGIRHPSDGVRQLLERKAFAYPGLRRIHVEAPSVKEAVTRRYGIGAEHILVVPPAVNLEEFRPPDEKSAARAAAGISDADGLVILFCGSDFERKGLDRAISALADVRDPAVLLVVGGGPAVPYRRLAVDLGVDDRVRFVGLRDDAWRFYQAADVFVLPTRSDIWGVTAIEAMACGVPPIVGAAAGSSSAIRDGEDGIVLPEPFEARALTAAIDLLAADVDRRASMARAGIATAKKHAWTACGQLVEEDLRAVAERRAQGDAIPRRRRRIARGSGSVRGEGAQLEGDVRRERL